MGVNLFKQSSTTFQMTLDVTDEDGKKVKYVYNVPRISNIDLLKATSNDTMAQLSTIYKLVEGSTPEAGAPPLSDIVNATDEAGLAEISEKLIIAASKSVIGD